MPSLRSVPGRLLAAFACVILFLVAQGVMSAVSQRRLTRQLEALNAARDQAITLLRLLDRAHTEVAIVVGSRNPELTDQHTAAYQATADALRQRYPSSEPERVQLQLLLGHYGRAVEYHSRFAFELAMEELARAVPAHDQLVSLVTGWLGAAEAHKEEAMRRSQRRASWATAVLGSLALLTALFLAWFLQRYLVDRERAERSLGRAVARLQGVLD